MAGIVSVLHLDLVPNARQETYEARIFKQRFALFLAVRVVRLDAKFSFHRIPADDLGKHMSTYSVSTLCFGLRSLQHAEATNVAVGLLLGWFFWGGG